MLSQYIFLNVTENVNERCKKMNIRRLKDLREDKEMAQKQIADILNTTQQQYSKYEQGVRLIPIDKLDILANFYETSTDYILGRTNIKEPYPRKKDRF